MATPAAISVKDLSVSRAGVKVLDKVSFEINAGRITYVIGGNGSGKTTLVRTILGLEKAGHGTITINAESVGYVPQYANIDRSFPISVAELIDLECQSQKQCPVCVADHLKVFNADHLLDRKISDLSGGELQKVLIARALVSDPSIVILDEPFNNLDHKSEVDLIILLRDLHQDHGKTIILITHDYNIIKAKDSDCILLSHKKVFSGSAEDILKQHMLIQI